MTHQNSWLESTGECVWQPKAADQWQVGWPNVTEELTQDVITSLTIEMMGCLLKTFSDMFNLVSFAATSTCQALLKMARWVSLRGMQ